MKKVELKELRKSKFWHDVLAVCQIDGSGKFAILSDELAGQFAGLTLMQVDPDTVEATTVITSMQIPDGQANPVRTPQEIKRLEAICGACRWNINWICQNIGCMPCKQAAAGGLKMAIKFTSFQCPEGNFTT